jgi:hypothetical protein
MNVSWRKSSYSTNNGGECVEIGVWLKSSHSTGNGGNCLEVATAGPGGFTAGDANCACGVVGRATGPATSAVGASARGRAGIRGAPWRKSSHSTTNGGSCVEAAAISATVAVRDTKDHGHGPVLRFTTAAWTTFTSTLN